MNTNLDNLKSAISELKLESEFKLLNESINSSIFNELESKFVNQEGLRGWWEDFKLPYQLIKGIDKP